MSGIYLDVPSVKVFIRQEGETKVTLTQPEVTAITTGSFESFAETSISASHAATASYAEFAANTTDVFPYSGSAVVTGSLEVTQTVKTNELLLNAGTVSMTLTGSVTSGIFGISEYVMPYISTVKYSGATIEYIAQRPGATRMGLLMATWSGSSIVFTDVSTADIGDTKDISFAFLHSSDEFRLRVNSNGSGSGAWTIQSLFRLFPNLN
jgi:hypothetical protein